MSDMKPCDRCSIVKHDVKTVQFKVPGTANTYTPKKNNSARNAEMPIVDTGDTGYDKSERK